MERLLKGVDIPPCPAVLTRLQQESASPNASLSVIATIIGSDVALSASVLKVANSTAFGLFHDCGIAVLMRRIPDYRETLQLANNSGDRNFTDIEDERHATNHAVLGYLLTRNWGLSEDICNATLLHHDLSIFEPTADATAAKARTLVSLAALAAYYVNGYQRLAEDSTWQRARTVVTAHLGINDNDLFDLRETAFETLESL